MLMIKKFIYFAMLLFLPTKALAVDVGVSIGGKTSFADFAAYILAVFSFALKLGAILTTLMVIYAGYKYMTSQGNPTAINEAKDIIVGSLTGFALLLLAYFLLNILGLPNPG